MQGPCDGAFFENNQGLLAVNYFIKQLHHNVSLLSLSLILNRHCFNGQYFSKKCILMGQLQIKGTSFLKLFFVEFSKKAKLMQQELDYHVNNTRNLDACGQQVITFYIISIFIKLFLSNVKILLFLGVFSQCVRKVFKKLIFLTS